MPDDLPTVATYVDRRPTIETVDAERLASGMSSYRAAAVGVGRLGGHARQEVLQPLLDVAALPDTLQPVVVARPVAFEPRAEVQQRLGQLASASVVR